MKAISFQETPQGTLVRRFADWHVLEAVLILGIFLTAALVSTPKEIPVLSSFPPCPFHKMTGYSCPGCGMTRAFISLAHGHPAEAFRLHLMSIPFFAFLLLRLGIDAGVLFFGKRIEIRYEKALLIALAAGFGVFGLLRLGLEIGGVWQTV